MANRELLALLKKGVQGWNEWREQNQDVIPDLAGADLHKASLAKAYLVGADIHKANLAKAYLSRADLYGADLIEVDLTGVDLTGANLTMANLRKADLHAAHLCKANLHRANLAHAILSWVDLTEADLTEADLHGANLHKADLHKADLHRADLHAAFLYITHLAGANLAGANLHGANLLETSFGNTNLTDTQGLDACHHVGPSFLDYRTLAISGPLPLAFLRGCGLPDQFIEYLPSLLNQAIQFDSCFISYSKKDQEFAERLHADLQNKGVRCWFAPKDMPGGKKLHEEIDKAIRLYDRLLLVLSEHSMNSEWVRKTPSGEYESKSHVRDANYRTR